MAVDTMSALERIIRRAQPGFFWVVAIAVTTTVAFSLVSGWAIATDQWMVAAFALLGIGTLLLLRLDPYLLFCTWLLVASTTERLVGLDLGAGIPDINFDRAIVLLTMFSVLVKTAIGQMKFPRLRVEDAALVAFAVFWLFSLVLRGINRTAEMGFFLQFVILPFGVFYLTRMLVNSRERLRQVLVFSLVAGAFQAVAAIYETITGINVIGRAVEIVAGGRLLRPGAFLGGPWLVATALTMLVPIGFHMRGCAPTSHQRRWYGFVLMLFGVVILQTTIRASWIAVLFALLVMLLERRQRRTAVMVLLFLIVTLVLLWPLIESSEIYRLRIANIQNILERRYLFSYQIRLWLENPLIGQGVGYGKLGKRSPAGTSSHSTLGSMLVDVGLLGVLPYVLAIGIIVWRSIRLYVRLAADDPFGRSLMIALWGGALAYVINAQAIEMRGHTYTTSLFWMFLALMTLSGEFTKDDLRFYLDAVHVGKMKQYVLGELKEGR